MWLVPLNSQLSSLNSGNVLIYLITHVKPLLLHLHRVRFVIGTLDSSRTIYFRRGKFFSEDRLNEYHFD